MGRKKIELNDSEVERLAGLGLTQGEIAIQLGISQDTLDRRKAENADIAEAIKKGQIAANEKVSNKLMTLIERGNLGAIIWYEKTRRGLSDRVEVNTWRDKVIAGLRKGELDPHKVIEELGVDLATELFNSAGVPIGQRGETLAASLNPPANSRDE